MLCPRCNTPMQEDGIKDFPAHTARLETCPECGLSFPTEETPANPGALYEKLRAALDRAIKLRRSGNRKRLRALLRRGPSPESQTTRRKR